MDISTDKDNADCIDLDLPELKAEILSKIYQCQQRGLTHSFKWLSEILYSLRKHGTLAATFPKVSLEQECEVYFLAKSYFDLKEYDRCAFFTGTYPSRPLVLKKHKKMVIPAELLSYFSNF